MRCPFCGNIDTQVKDSRPAEDHVSPSGVAGFAPLVGAGLRPMSVFSCVILWS